MNRTMQPRPGKMPMHMPPMMGRHLGSMMPMGPPKVTVNLVQKPTKKHQAQLDKTIRGMKKTGYDLYFKQKNETHEVITKL